MRKFATWPKGKSPFSNVRVLGGFFSALLKNLGAQKVFCDPTARSTLNALTEPEVETLKAFEDLSDLLLCDLLEEKSLRSILLDNKVYIVGDAANLAEYGEVYLSGPKSWDGYGYYGRVFLVTTSKK